jgi:hypothetical protein
MPSRTLQDCPCDQCGKPSTSFARDVVRDLAAEELAQDGYAYFKGGAEHFGCDDHPVTPMMIDPGFSADPVTLQEWRKGTIRTTE